MSNPPSDLEPGVGAQLCDNPDCGAVHLCIVNFDGDEINYALTDETWTALFLEVATLQKERAGKVQ